MVFSPFFHSNEPVVSPRADRKGGRGRKREGKNHTGEHVQLSCCIRQRSTKAAPLNTSCRCVLFFFFPVFSFFFFLILWSVVFAFGKAVFEDIKESLAVCLFSSFWSSWRPHNDACSVLFFSPPPSPFLLSTARTRRLYHIAAPQNFKKKKTGCFPVNINHSHKKKKKLAEAMQENSKTTVWQHRHKTQTANKKKKKKRQA